MTLQKFRYLTAESLIFDQKASDICGAFILDIYRKHLSQGLILDTSTSFKIPTSPRGLVFSWPSTLVQVGGQLRLRL